MCAASPSLARCSDGLPAPTTTPRPHPGLVPTLQRRTPRQRSCGTHTVHPLGSRSGCSQSPPGCPQTSGRCRVVWHPARWPSPETDARASPCNQEADKHLSGVPHAAPRRGKGMPPGRCHCLSGRREAPRGAEAHRSNAPGVHCEAPSGAGAGGAAHGLAPRKHARPTAGAAGSGHRPWLARRWQLYIFKRSVAGFLSEGCFPGETTTI